MSGAGRQLAFEGDDVGAEFRDLGLLLLDRPDERWD